MMDRVGMKAIGAILALVLCVAGSDAVLAQAQQAPQAEPTKESVGRRLESVKTLIEKSSADKQVEGSGGEEANQKRDQARALLKQANDAYEAGDYRKANALLDDAAKQMIGGVRKSEPAAVVEDKKRRDFDNRLDSVKALQDALTRINKEKKSGAKGDEVVAKVDAMVKEAVQLRDAGQIEKGRAKLDQAYFMAKVAVQNLREGDTLVRELKFTSKEEEYKYELDRNDTHQMLITVLVDQKGGSDAAVQERVSAAGKIRKEAEGMAGKGEYDAAIKKLDDSTRELIKAIRAAGIFIPG
jgi:hypothetical protein